VERRDVRLNPAASAELATGHFDVERDLWWRRKGARQLRAILLAWDPVGVTADRADWPYVFDEYDAYLRPLFHILGGGATTADVTRFLDGVVTRLGLEHADTSGTAKTITTWFANMAPPPSKPNVTRVVDEHVQDAFAAKTPRHLRLRRKTEDGIWRAGRLVNDISDIVDVTRTGDRLVMDLNVLGHWLKISPPSEYIETEDLPTDVRVYRWRSPVLPGRMVIRHVERYRTNRRAVSGGPDLWVDEIDGRLRIRVGRAIYVRVAALDVTVEIRPDPIGTAPVEESFLPGGVWSSSWWGPFELFDSEDVSAWR
jgi:hypothetical protein